MAIIVNLYWMPLTTCDRNSDNHSVVDCGARMDYSWPRSKGTSPKFPVRIYRRRTAYGVLISYDGITRVISRCIIGKPYLETLPKYAMERVLRFT